MLSLACPCKQFLNYYDAVFQGYTLEGYPGTKKPSFIEPKKKKALLAKAREEALKKAQ